MPLKSVNPPPELSKVELVYDGKIVDSYSRQFPWAGNLNSGILINDDPYYQIYNQFQVPADKKPEFLIAPLKYLDKYVFNKDKEESFTTLTNAISKHFTIAVLSIAIISTLFWLFYDASKAMNVFTVIGPLKQSKNIVFLPPNV